jgi:alcohol dehydrogenase YqhD (iron-dependent ADH family)
MINFDFGIKTKLYFGREKENEIADILTSFNYKKVLIVIGKGSVKKIGLFDKVIDKLNASNIIYKALEGVRANPSITLCREGVRLAREFQPDVILAIGGGSVIDTAKSIAVGYYYEGDTFDFNLHKVVPTKALPIGVILTLSASGSEMSTSCVIQDDETHIKMGFNSEIVRPVFAIENPELTYTVNDEQTTYGIVDILMHTFERYFQPSGEFELADRFAEGLIKTVIDAAYKVKSNPTDYDARAALMLASSISHCGYTSIGKKSYMPVHQLEHALSGLYKEVAHGAGLSILFPAWANYYAQYDPQKFALFARNVFSVTIEDDLQAAYKGIRCLIEFFKDINAPLTYKDVGLENVDIDRLVKLLTNNNTRVVNHHVKNMDASVAYEIYKKCI